MLTVKIGSFYDPGVYDLGVQVIKEHVRMASLAFIRLTTSRTQAQEIAQSVAFVQGSDLDYILAELNEPIDAEVFRESFYALCAKRRQRLLKSQSSSVITADAS